VVLAGNSQKDTQENRSDNHSEFITLIISTGLQKGSKEIRSRNHHGF
jgi:hypothetical protein